jgi:hypothetical protein
MLQLGWISLAHGSLSSARMTCLNGALGDRQWCHCYKNYSRLPDMRWDSRSVLLKLALTGVRRTRDC